MPQRDGVCCVPGGLHHLRSVRLTAVEGPEAEIACAAACRTEAHCKFFAFTPARRCELCSNCVLAPRAMSRSWPRNWMGCPRTSIGSLISTMAYDLQHEYSMRLYRRPGAIQFDHLHVLFADMLPRRTLRALESVGVCRAEAAPPFNPFYWGHDVVANPTNAIWIHRTYGPQPVPDNSWIEVTHCAAVNSAFSGMSYAMWLYAAPGSGVSINVGRTKVATDYSQALHLLRSAFPKRGLAPAGGKGSGAGPEHCRKFTRSAEHRLCYALPRREPVGELLGFDSLQACLFTCRGCLT